MNLDNRQSPSPSGPGSANRILTFFTFVVVTGCLYFTKDLLMPIAMAVLLSFLLSPVSTWLEKRRVPRIAAVVSLVAVMALFTVGGGYIVGAQFVDFANNISKYKNNIIIKAKVFKPKKNNFWKRMESTIGEVQKEVATNEDTTGSQKRETISSTLSTTFTQMQAKSVPASNLSHNTLSGDKKLITNADPIKLNPTPIPVKVVESEDGGALRLVSSIITPIMNVIATIGLIGLLVIFILLQREDLRDRFMKLVGGNNIRTTTEALEEAASRVSRYLGMQLIVNVTYGIALSIGLLVIGLPNAFLWGALASILRFVPYIGPWIAAAIPVALSLAVFDSWYYPILVIGLFLVIELLSNNVMEPILYGQSTGISPVAIIVSAIFWAWIWGPMGLILATPITVCLVVIGRHVPHFAFFSVLLGDEPPLSDDARVYNRLLSGNTDNALEISEDYLQKNSYIELCDNVLVPALKNAEVDCMENQLSSERYNKLIKDMQVLIESLSDTEEQNILEAPSLEGEAEKTSENVNNDPSSLQIIKQIAIIPVQDAGDYLTAMMVATAARKNHHKFIVLSQHRLVSETIEDLKPLNPDAIVLSALPPFTVINIRSLCKRLRLSFPNTKIYIGCWAIDPVDSDHVKSRLSTDIFDGIFTSIKDLKPRL